MQLIRSSTVRSSADVISGILNCVCPECGGRMGERGQEFRCRGECLTRRKRFALSGTCSSGAKILGSIEPEWFKGIFQAIPEGIAEATAEREKPIGLFALLKRLTSKDSLRGLAAAIDFLQAFGRHLQSAGNPQPRD